MFPTPPKQGLHRPRGAVVTLCTALLGLALLVPAPAAAARAKKKRAARPTRPAAAAPAGDTAMKAWLAQAEPGAPHALLAKMAGAYALESRFYAGPEAAPQLTAATVEQSMVLGGRYLRQEFTGTMNGQAYQGFGVLGFDNVKSTFFSFWVDAVSTAPLQHEGGCADAECKTLDLRGQYLDPATRKPKSTRVTFETRDDGKLVQTLYDVDARGRPFKSLELVYTRK
jgi:hypothetical protein